MAERQSIRSDAFALAFDGTKVPNGRGFLEYFRDVGCWLLDRVDRPVDHLERRECREIVESGAPRLARTIGDTHAKHVVAVKKTLVGPAVLHAVRIARYQPDGVSILPFPLYSRQKEYVQGLAEIVTSTLDAPALGVNARPSDSRPVADELRVRLTDRMLAAGEPKPTIEPARYYA